jgi:hypothetical protein
MVMGPGLVAGGLHLRFAHSLYEALRSVVMMPGHFPSPGQMNTFEFASQADLSARVDV